MVDTSFIKKPERRFESGVNQGWSDYKVFFVKGVFQCIKKTDTLIQTGQPSSLVKCCTLAKGVSHS